MRTSKRTSSANGNQGSHWITPVRRLALYLRDEFHCLYCGRDLHGANPHDITLDHVRCRNRDEKPDHSNGNLVTCCRSCNSKRQDRKLSVFLVAVWPTNKFLVAITAQVVRNHLRRDMKKYVRLAKSIISERHNVKQEER